MYPNGSANLPPARGTRGARAPDAGPPDEIADVLARSCGHLGTGAEYLLNTVTQLERRGMHDPGLWRLQELVAERIGAV